MKILVVDDELMQLKSMKIGLRTERHSVVTAQSAEEAHELVKTDPSFDLIITDYLMPGISGLDLLKAVREIRPFVPVILMTAFGRKDLAIEALKTQYTGFIEKPFSLEQLLGEMTRVINLEMQNRSSQAFNNNLARVVHQINNPLAAIKENAEFALCRTSDPEALKHNLQAILEATGMISEINRKIMSMGTAEKDAEPWGKVDLQWLLADCLDMFEGLMSMRGILIESTVNKGNLFVFGDRFGLQQIFRNLILNAVEAMEGSVKKTLRIGAERDENAGWIAVHIEDTGCGIPESLGKELFTSSRTTKENGSGLGLLVVRNVVEKHRGHLRMNSKEGEGTLITVRLPDINKGGNHGKA